MVDLAANKVFKPNKAAYLTLCGQFGYRASEVMMVSGNKHFGDIETAPKVGMKSRLIRQKDGLDTLDDLAESLGV